MRNKDIQVGLDLRVFLAVNLHLELETVQRSRAETRGSQVLSRFQNSIPVYFGKFLLFGALDGSQLFANLTRHCPDRGIVRSGLDDQGKQGRTEFVGWDMAKEQKSVKSLINSPNPLLMSLSSY